MAPRIAGRCPRLVVFAVAVTLSFGLPSTLTGSGAESGGAPESGEWVERGGDKGASLYSPLHQIDTSNVDRLEIAWRWRSDSFSSAAGSPGSTHGCATASTSGRRFGRRRYLRAFDWPTR